MGKILHSKDVKFYCAWDSVNNEVFDLIYKHSSFEVEMLLIKLNVLFGSQKNHLFISTPFHGRGKYVAPLAILCNWRYWKWRLSLYFKHFKFTLLYKTLEHSFYGYKNLRFIIVKIYNNLLGGFQPCSH